MDPTRKVSNLSIKSTNDDTQEIIGYASTFGGIDSWGDSIAPGAFTDTIRAHQVSDNPVPVLFEHSRQLDSHVGEVHEMREDEHGLFIRAVLDSTPEGKKAYALVKSRRIKGLSIGFFPVEVSASEVDGTAVNLVEKLDLAEISLVLNPADSGALITSVKSAYDGEKTPQGPRISAYQLAQITKGADLDDFDRVEAALDHQLETLEKRDRMDDYRNYLKTGWNEKNGATAQSKYRFLNSEQRAQIEREVLSGILRTAEKNGRGLSTGEAEHAEYIRNCHKEWVGAEKRKAVIDMVRNAGDNTISHLDPDPTPYINEGKEASMSSKFPLTKSAAPRLAGEAAEQIRRKSLVGAPSAELYIPTQTHGVVEDGRPVHNLLDLVPGKVVENGSAFTYFRQTERELRADRVPVGERKPESSLGFERVDANLEVVAHVVRGIDKYVVQDLQAIRDVIGNEMIAGVASKVEAWATEELLASPGHVVEPFAGDAFATVRLGISRLQNIGLEASAIVLHPTTWAQIETTRADGDGQFVFNGAPVNQEQQLLWGVPVVTSIAVPEGKGIALDMNSFDIFFDERAAIAWHVSGEEFSRNQLSIRAEGRFHPVVLRGPGVVELLLDADAKPTPVSEAVPVPTDGADGGVMTV